MKVVIVTNVMVSGLLAPFGSAGEVVRIVLRERPADAGDRQRGDRRAVAAGHPAYRPAADAAECLEGHPAGQERRVMFGD